ncbi:hypothetical protein HMSSN036_00970 [Paenibacillus macerans]|nr:hypothetical protein HMSSN036_00970 [Paenibacillus macerans]
MFTRSDDKITTSQAVVFLTDSILGAGILTLPRSATEEVQTPDAWLSVVLASVLALLVVFIMIKLSQQFPGNTVFEFSQKIAGVIPGSALSALLIVFFMMMAVFEIRMLAEVTIFLFARGHSHLGHYHSFYMGGGLFDFRRNQLHCPLVPDYFPCEYPGFGAQPVSQLEAVRYR